jgi:pyrimidine operon attenuation protein/uracil phosphoribosyltransferase
MTADENVQIMDAVEIDRSLTRIAHEILEKNRESSPLGIVGIRTRGVPIAQRLTRILSDLTGAEMQIGLLDINLYRDDVSAIADHPVLRKTEIPFDVDGAKIVLVDDVLFTGRTVRAAIEALLDLGRPRRIMLAVLVDRGHRELPIRADFVGKNVPTSRGELVDVRLAETDDRDAVVLMQDPKQKTASDNEGQQ